MLQLKTKEVISPKRTRISLENQQENILTSTVMGFQ